MGATILVRRCLGAPTKYSERFARGCLGPGAGDTGVEVSSVIGLDLSFCRLATSGDVLLQEGGRGGGGVAVSSMSSPAY